MQAPRVTEDYPLPPWPAKLDHDGQHFSLSSSNASATADNKYALPSDFVAEALSGNSDPEIQSILKEHQVH